MKKLYLIISLSILLFSCEDKNDSPTKDTSVSFTTKDTISFRNEPFGVLGYGYDLTSNYAHPSGVRRKVIDIVKYNEQNSNRVYTINTTSFGGRGVLTGTKKDIKKQLLTNLEANVNNETYTYKNVFKDIFDSPFQSDLSNKDKTYYYAIDAYENRFKSYYFTGYTDLVLPYLTKGFTDDIKNKSAEEIILTYGTHILANVVLGIRQDYYYRSTSDTYLEQRLVSNSIKFFNSTPGTISKPNNIPYNEKEDIYTEYIGGYHSYPNAWMFDITNYDGHLKYDFKLELTDRLPLSVLIGLGNQSLIPIYELVKDDIQKEAIKKAYINYLNN